jgi:3-methyl-2-oxobutanoate hydroxymethyltransferase
MRDDHPPRFVKVYGQLRKALTDAAQAYAADVVEGRFPAEEQTYH